MRTVLYTCIIAALVAVGTAGCDFSEQNLDWVPGDSLMVVGPVDAAGGAISEAALSADGHPVVIQPVDAYFYVSAFTTEQEYTWSINGSAISEMDNAAVLNGGEFLRISLSAPGLYTIAVDSGDMGGSRTIVVENPSS